MSVNIPVFVISLPQAKERRLFMQAQLERLHLSFEFFDAFNGKDYADNQTYYSEKKALKAEGRKLTVGEIGCALSHSEVYRLIVKRKLPYALILEDDAILSAELPVILQKLIPFLHGNNIITLERCDIYKKSSIQPLINNYSLVSPRFIKEGSIAQAAGYLISGEAAAVIQNINRPVYFPADSWGYYKKYVHFFALIPSQSCIHQNKEFHSSTLDTKNARTFSNTKAFTFILHGFFTYTLPGRIIYKFIHPLYKKVRQWKS